MPRLKRNLTDCAIAFAIYTGGVASFAVAVTGLVSRLDPRWLYATTLFLSIGLILIPLPFLVLYAVTGADEE